MSRSTYAPVESYTGNGSVSAYTFDFKITTLSQLLVIEMDADGVTENQRVRGTDTTYLSSVTFDAENGGGTVNLAANLVASRKLYILLAEDAPKQTFEFRQKNTFTLKRFENALDEIAGAVQRLAYRAARSLRLHESEDESAFDLRLPPGATTKQDRLIKINADGDGFDYGLTEGTIAAAEGFSQDAADSATAALASENAAAASELLASQWASLTTGLVDATEYSAKAWAIGGTGVTGVANRGAAKEWATTTGSKVDGASGDYSAKEWALGTATRGAAGGGSAKDWANYVDGSNTVDDTEFSAKYYAEQASTAGTDASAAQTAAEAAQTAAEAAQDAAEAAALTAGGAPLVVAEQQIGTGGTINHTGDYRQIREVRSVIGTATVANAPFGTDDTNFVDGMEITLWGNSDSTHIKVPIQDIQYGIVAPGFGTGVVVSLQNYWSMTVFYNASKERFILKSLTGN